MATKFVALRADLIDEGQFLGDLDEELAELQEAIAKYRKAYGDKAKKAKAKLVIEIEISCEDADDDAFAVKTTFKVTMPKKPASVSLAMSGEDDAGRLALFVRKTGSDDYSPKQAKLTTRDGRAIDHETGEAAE